ncbi:MAG: hypothetical protein KBS86_00960 [Proteobacteria bacterium]|nr:hypothetical protein [Candidatus Enterousia scatequi]
MTPALCAEGLRSDTSASRAQGYDVRNTSRNTDSSAQISRSVKASRSQPSINHVSDRSSAIRPDQSTPSRFSGIPSAIQSNNIAVMNNVDNRQIIGRSTKAVSAESLSQAKEVLEQTAELNKSCQDQYNECMDQFCAVVDANQKRCSCSANLSKYSKVEEAVTNANAELNEIAQRIRYVGLSADEIRAIMTATEAETAIDGQRDVSETRNMLDDIENLIKDPTAITTYYSTGSSGFGLDMDLDFSSSDADLFNLDFLTDTTAASISNKRGSELYNVAKRRCNTILNECKKAGGTISQVTGNYDLAIDKDCIAYEQGLSKMNDTLVSNVRSANLLLQKARLAVLQNKNQYDARECIGALETCMLDDMVCGNGYVKCLDPTKKYIDENGSVVLGQNINKIKNFLGDDFDNSNIGNILDNLEGIYLDVCDTNGECIVKYLMTKIGTGKTFKDGGLCRPVLDKCQYYTYVNGTYQPKNDVVINYLQRAMTNIKAQQSQIISDYASSCMLDVADCYNQQVTQVNTWSSVASAESIKNVMTGACRNVALTCAYAVFANQKDRCYNETGCINSISEIFYQSLLCPENSKYAVDGCPGSASNGCVSSMCKCNTGYEVWGSSCVLKCDGNTETRNTYGVCVSK